MTNQRESDKQGVSLLPDPERFRRFPNGPEVHVDVPYVEGVDHYIVRLCYVTGHDEFGEVIAVADQFHMSPDPDLLPAIGHRWQWLDPDQEWRVHVTPVLADAGGDSSG